MKQKGKHWHSMMVCDENKKPDFTDYLVHKSSMALL